MMISEVAMRFLARAVAVAGVLAGTSAVAVAQPAWACGCGAMISDSSLSVTDETSIVRYDARTRTEDIVMRLSVDSDAKDAAWLFPTPTEAQVKPGDRTWFEQLDRLTEPRVETTRRWFGSTRDMAGAPAPGEERVSVLAERRVGPFQTATLDATDSGALADWLRANGYRLSPRLKDALRPYVRDRWKYVAVKLAPEGGSIKGALDPLHVTFRAYPRMVYPMRLSRLAKDDQALHLYVLGDHRVVQTSPAPPLRTTFAGAVTPGQVASPGLRDFLGEGMYLTEMVRRDIPPEQIEDDYRFDRAATDAPFREVVHETDYVEIADMPAGWVLVIGGTILLGTAFTIITLRRRPRTRPR